MLGYNVWAWDGFAIFGGAVLDVEDFLVSNLFLPLGSLVYLLFCVTRYGWGWDNYKKEVNTGKGLKMHDWMRGYLTYGLPSLSCSSSCSACTISSSPDKTKIRDAAFCSIPYFLSLYFTYRPSQIFLQQALMGNQQQSRQMSARISGVALASISRMRSW